MKRPPPRPKASRWRSNCSDRSHPTQPQSPAWPEILLSDSPQRRACRASVPRRLPFWGSNHPCSISPPPVFRGLCQHTEHPPQLLKLFRAQHRPDTPIEPLATTEETLDQTPPLLGQIHPYHPGILWITLPPEQALSLEPLGQARNPRGIDLEPVAQLSLTHPVFPGEQCQGEPGAGANAHLSLKSALYPPESKA